MFQVSLEVLVNFYLATMIDGDAEILQAARRRDILSDLLEIPNLYEDDDEMKISTYFRFANAGPTLVDINFSNFTSLVSG